MDDFNRATLRVPQELHGEMVAEARRLGVSVNALVLVALRDYLDRRRPPASGEAGLGPAGPNAAGRSETDCVERPQSDLKRSGGTQVPPVQALAEGIAARVSAGPSKGPRAATSHKRRRKR